MYIVRHITFSYLAQLSVSLQTYKTKLTILVISKKKNRGKCMCRTIVKIKNKTIQQQDMNNDCLLPTNSNSKEVHSLFFSTELR